MTFLCKDCVDKDATIADLDEQITELQKRIEFLENQIYDLKRDKEHLQSCIDDAVIALERA